MKINFKYFTKGEWALWLGSVLVIAVSFVLWTMATVTSISYLSVIICFVVFFVNDLYGFISWKRMQRQQSE